jgi:non-ribosomal peptide synthetase component F
MFMVVLAAYKVMLMKYSRQEDILVGTPYANRCEDSQMRQQGQWTCRC